MREGTSRHAATSHFCASVQALFDGPGEFQCEIQDCPLFLSWSKSAPDTIFAFFDLGLPENARQAHHALLCLNAPISPPAHGFFAVDPVLGSVLYRVQLPKRHIADPRHLYDVLEALLKQARTWCRTHSVLPARACATC